MKKNKFILVSILVFLGVFIFSFCYFIMNNNFSLSIGEGKNILIDNCSSLNDNVIVYGKRIYGIKMGSTKLSCPLGLSYNVNVSDVSFKEGESSLKSISVDGLDVFNVYDTVSDYLGEYEINDVILVDNDNNILVKQDKWNYAVQSEGSVKFLVIANSSFVIEIIFTNTNISNATVNSKKWRASYPNVLKTKELHRSLNKEEKKYINNIIKKNTTENNKYGTADAVAGAAVGLIKGLYDKNLHLPYYYGGGHNTSSVKIGVDPKFGKKLRGYWYSYNSGRGRYYYSYDCSAFVVWAIKNGCNSNFSKGKNYSTGSMFSWGKSTSNIRKASVGDLMLKDGHVRLVVEKLSDGSIVTAESTASYASHGGVQFQRYTSLGKFKIIKMSKFYKKTCKN